MPTIGGFIFAEHPSCSAPDATIIWHAALDPGTLRVDAVPIDAFDPERVTPRDLARWLAIAERRDPAEHVVLSDGWHHIRLDLETGSLAEGPVILQYRLAGLACARPALASLRRFIDLCLHHRFSSTLFPADRRIPRWIVALRVHDALRSGASQREIGVSLFGRSRIIDGWSGRSDSLRSRVRRLARDARWLAAGGYRQLLSARESPREPSPDD